MEPLTKLTSVVAPLLRDNVDTDAIIPAAWLRSLATDPGTGLFARWRYLADGSENPGFVLNDPRFRRASILLSGANFGCGSSRENAVWALSRFGIRCIIARSYSDIFHENCFKNGVLPIIVSPRDHAVLVQSCTQDTQHVVTVDVAAGTIRAQDASVYRFDLDERKRGLLMSGSDEITATLARADRIEAFRMRQRQAQPWLYDVAAEGDA
ncbi:MAG TPA: 3-isopropylmalate dehydratase small subunit [Casimicrobiaceae bacterium]|nr:3-isopropylmalate dehydratase small subunit [Casimicrobiaceae bacterium]